MVAQRLDPVLRSIRLPLPEGEVRKILVVFGLSRGLPRGLELLSGQADWVPRGLSVRVLPDSPNVVEITLTAEALAMIRDKASDPMRPLQEKGARITSWTLTSAGEVPEFLYLAVYDEAGGEGEAGLLTTPVIYRVDGELCVDDPAVTFVVDPAPTLAAEPVFSFEKYADELSALLAGMPDGDPRKRATEFFAVLDQQTSRAINVGRETEEPLLNVSDKARLTLPRLLEARLETPKTPQEQLTLLSPTSRTSVAKVAGGLLAIAVDKFPVQADHRTVGGFDLDDFEQAFESFASGGLRQRLAISGAWTTQPSSGFYFLFAELAFAAHHLAATEPTLDAATWLAVANVMTRTQRLFGRAYAPKEELLGEAVYSTYESCNYCKNEPCDPDELSLEISDLRTAYEGKSLTDLMALAASNAKHFMPGLVAS